MHAPFEGLIETEAGPAFVHIEGKGPRCLVFHGGPGFEHRSLRSALGDLAMHREVVYFDQLACGKTPIATAGEATADATFAHAAAVLDAVATEDVGIVAHSWGTIVAAAALMRRPGLTARESILICPSPLEGEGYAAAAAAIDGRIPLAAKEEMMARVTGGASGQAIFEAIAPYYATSPGKALPSIPVSAGTFFSVSGSLGDGFDFRPAIARFGRVSVIRGAEDFTPVDTITPILDSAEIDIELPGIGHFPHFEDPAGFAAALLAAIGGKGRPRS